MNAPGNIRHVPLPEPDSAASEHSERLCHRIREEISGNNGYICFSRYMQMVLYEPGLGYYSAGACKFGRAGDFITAPEISSLFTECLAQQCRQLLAFIKKPVILEAGAGSGTMLCDLLKVLEEKNTLPDKYLVLETSADLRDRQQSLVRAKIPHLEKIITWLDELPAQPLDGIIIGNEVLDALPVHRVKLVNGNFLELCVCLNGKNFDWTEKSLSNELQEYINVNLIKYISGLPEGYKTEVNIQIKPWLMSLADILNKGVMLFIDYGYPQHEYYHPQRTEGTLLCHYRHHAHDDPFLYPGLQDITASVDFTNLAKSAVTAGLGVGGYTTQAHFLLNCGLEEILQKYYLTMKKEHDELARQSRLLTMPGEMGERFKVIALTKDFEAPMTGFTNFDQRQRL